MIETYKQLLHRQRIVPSLLMLEIIEKLFNRTETETPYGLTELFDNLSCPKPTFSSFRKQISALEYGECVRVFVSKEKASKKCVVLTSDFSCQLNIEVYS